MDRLNNVVEPAKELIEDLEILAFENEEQLNFYTIWHEALVDKRRESNAVSDRERQIIRNEIARKTRQLISIVSNDEQKKKSKPPGSSKSSRPSVPKSSTPSKSQSNVTSTPLRSPKKPHPAPAPAIATAETATGNAPPAKPSNASHLTQAVPTRRILPSGVYLPFESTQIDSSYGSHFSQPCSAKLSNGLTILNSTHFDTVPSGKVMMKYKLTKLYNKFRGRQMRRNFVHEKQRNARIELEISKSYLNSWLAYTALQALRLPEQFHSLSAATTNGGKILTPLAQPIMSMAPTKKSKSPNKKQQFKSPQTTPSTQTGAQQKLPMHLVYMNPGSLITYSNRINPQQVAEYKRKAHLLPSSATSKKSSAASYDVYEIMEVLANTNKTNVTITRNANRPSQQGSSIYSHSVNSSTPGIVSTQLHLQAKSYVDIMAKFYAEEYERLEKEKKEMEDEPTSEEIIKKYLKNAQTNGTNLLPNQETTDSTAGENPNSPSKLISQVNAQADSMDIDEEDELESLEEDIKNILTEAHKSRVTDNRHRLNLAAST